VNFSLPPTDYFLINILKFRLFFGGKKLDLASFTRYYLIMETVAKIKFMSLLRLSKIYPKNQLKSIRKNSFLCATISNCPRKTNDTKLDTKKANKALQAILDCVAFA